jgi:hypothetical protein
MKIKHENGIVTFLMRTGKDFVRSTMTIASAMGIINHGGNVVEENNQIIVDDTYFFPAIPDRKKKESDEE